MASASRSRSRSPRGASTQAAPELSELDQEELYQRAKVMAIDVIIGIIYGNELPGVTAYENILVSCVESKAKEMIHEAMTGRPRSRSRSPSPPPTSELKVLITRAILSSIFVIQFCHPFVFF